MGRRITIGDGLAVGTGEPDRAEPARLPAEGFRALLGILAGRRFLILPAAVTAFLLRHALRGRCPPAPLLRGRGVRMAAGRRRRAEPAVRSPRSRCRGPRSSARWPAAAAARSRPAAPRPRRCG